MRHAIYGGSFNPIHNDHVRLALRFLDEFELDRVTLIPTNMTPLKDNTSIALGLHRYEMCRLATEGYGKIEVSDIEIKRDGMSYTSDTVAAMKKDGDELFLIVGADMYVTLDRWHDFGYIFDNTTILAAPRNELDYSSLEEKYREYKELYGCKTLISHEPIGGLSSTKIRERIKKGESLDKMVAPSVEKYIFEHSIYG